MGMTGVRHSVGDWDSLEFRVESDELAPAEVSARLRLEPTESYEKGAAYYPDQPDKRRFDTNIWIFHRRSTRFSALPEIVDVLHSRAIEISQIASVASTSLVWHAKLLPGQETVELPVGTIEKLAGLNTGLTVAIFS